jgi:hypothetical protein
VRIANENARGFVIFGLMVLVGFVVVVAFYRWLIA